MSVAIASGHTKHNFGSMLQAYAMQEHLALQGYDVRTIDMTGLEHEISIGRFAYFRSRLTDIEYLAEKGPFALHRVQQKIYPGFRRNMSARHRSFDVFAKDRFHLTRKTYTFDELRQMSREYDAVIVGSDQLWTPANIAGGYFTLEWVDGSVQKLSYATSVGLSQLEPREMGRMGAFLRGYHAISVREDSGASIVQQATGHRPTVVCDPSMLLTLDDWVGIANESYHAIPDDPYVLCYFMGNNPWQRDCVVEYARSKGLKVVAIAHTDTYIPSDNDYADVYPWDAGPAEWLALIKHADLVCTDSFHGTVFSNIFHTPFVSFRRHASGSEQSTNSRIDTLLEELGLSCRICEGAKCFSPLAAQGIDFTEPQRRLDEYRQRSADWLEQSLTFIERDAPRHIEVRHVEDCCGCASCANSCPVGCIAMEFDSEGCEYPHVDENRCIGCGKCIKACPITNVEQEEPRAQCAFVVQNKDDSILRQSTSGGAFTALATTVIGMGGVVFGAGYDRDGKSGYDAPLNVRCMAAENTDDLRFFRNSKYIQSEIGDAYRQVEEYLNEGRFVLFSGTPCQCEGLHRYFGGMRPRGLGMADIVCHAVPCRAFFKAYLNWLNNTTGQNVGTVLFRDKGRWGYEYSNLRAFEEDEPFETPTAGIQAPAFYSAGVESDPYLRAFFSDLSDRPSCYRCMFKKRHRITDVTMWDCFDAWRYGDNFDDNRGATRLLVHTALGQDLLDASLDMLHCKEIDVDQATRLAYELTHSVKGNSRRGEMFQDLEGMEPVEFFGKWFPDSAGISAKRGIRALLEKTGTYSTAKKTLWKIREGS